MTVKGSIEAQGKESRAQRGLQLFRERGSEIVVYLDGTYGVPSRTEEDLVYHVDLKIETCECRDFEIRRVSCLHQFAAMMKRARMRSRGTVPALACRRGRSAA